MSSESDFALIGKGCEGSRSRFFSSSVSIPLACLSPSLKIHIMQRSLWIYFLSLHFSLSLVD